MRRWRHGRGRALGTGLVLRLRGLLVSLIIAVPTVAHAQLGVFPPQAPDPLIPQILGPDAEKQADPEKADAKPPPLKPEGSTEAADGTSITRDNYPTQTVLRPLVLPRGLWLGTLEFHYPGLKQTPYFALRAFYGIGSGFSLGAFVDVWGLGGGGVSALYQLTGNIALYARVLYQFDAGGTLHGQRFAGEFGVPIKFQLPGAPLAVSALGTIFQLNNTWYPTTNYVGPAELRPSLIDETVFLPVSLGFSPLPWLSLSLGGTARYNTGASATSRVALVAQSRASMALDGSLSATFTLGRFDLGGSFGASRYFSATTNTDSIGASAFASARF